MYRQPAEDSNSCTDSLLKTVLVSAASHQLYRQPAEDSTCVCSCPLDVQTACWRQYLCLQLTTICTDSLLKTVLVSAADHQLYRQPAEDSICVCSCPPAVQTACWRQYLCLQLPTRCTDSLLKTILVFEMPRLFILLFWTTINPFWSKRTMDKIVLDNVLVFFCHNDH